MYGILNYQVCVFFYSILLGFFLGVVYDIFRLFRIIINTSNIWIFCQDILYFILSSLITFIFILTFNNGEFRLYVILGECIGWIIYYASLGEWIYSIARKIKHKIELKTRKNKQND